MTASTAELLGDFLTNGNSFTQTNLVSDGTVPAELIDPNLINPWGISTPGPTGPFWISDNNAGVTTFYNGDGSKVGQVAIAGPPGSTAAGTPTGQVFNRFGTGFDISQNGEELHRSDCPQRICAFQCPGSRRQAVRHVCATRRFQARRRRGRRPRLRR